MHMVDVDCYPIFYELCFVVLMLLFVLIILTFACAFFSGSEAAIFSQDAGRLSRSVVPGFSLKLRKTLLGWLKRPERVPARAALASRPGQRYASG